MKLTLPYPPSANRYWRNFRGRMVVSAEARAYKRRVAGIFIQERPAPFIGVVNVRIAVYRPQRRGDLDNTLKVLLDSLKGLAYDDDDQIVSIAATRHDDKANPRAEIEIELMDGAQLALATK